MKNIVFWSLSIFSPLCLSSIGISTEYYEDTSRNRSIEARVLYPTSKGQSEELLAENPAFYGFKAAANANPVGQQLPVYFLVHGTSGNWKNLSWLGSALAESGALVVSANHPDYTTGQATPESVIRLWEQPRDVSFLISEILSSKFAFHIDKDNITVVGFSLGGYTALALAGARLDMSGYEKYCSLNTDVSCNYFQDAFEGLSQNDRLMISGDHRDKRVKRSVAIAPGFVPAILPGSLQDLSADTLVIGAELDQNVPPALQLKPHLNSDSTGLRYIEIDRASHFSFMQICKPDAIAILAEEKAEFVCQDAVNVDRKSIHQQLFEVVVQQDRKL
ncbi:alpha/beta hydrolase family protein [Allohahella sp. A8]|uniref:alpha/beta hydrolase family protein n=1 Tax=Allohahella sp. A8 TaxID=3141461 RepID=UPI003A810660